MRPLNLDFSYHQQSIGQRMSTARHWFKELIEEFPNSEIRCAMTTGKPHLYVRFTRRLSDPVDHELCVTYKSDPEKRWLVHYPAYSGNCTGRFTALQFNELVSHIRDIEVGIPS